MARRWIAVLLLVFAAGEGQAAPLAKQLFGAERTPSAGAAEPLGSYAKGCVAGAVELPETGPGWQAMRLSRNRNWGHPDAIRFVERLSRDAQSAGWPGLYIGDISQPRGGPMLTGHRSHQIGLDIDIWLRRPSGERLSRADRERISSHVVVAADRKGVNDHWTESHGQVLRAAASDAAVARIFVNAAIKARLCRDAAADDRDWLRKIRPWWGHGAHFHVRLSCPAGAASCIDQDPPPPGDGCDDSLAWWFSDEALYPKPSPGTTKAQREFGLSDLPAACAQVLSR